MLNNSQPKWLIGLTAFAFLCGIFLVATSLRKADRAHGLRRMTCEDLIGNGPGTDQFLTLTDVHLCSAGHAVRRDTDAAMEMYIPIFSDRLKQEPQPADIALLLEVLDDRDREQLLECPDVGELNVELWTRAAQLDPWVLDRLGSIYPGIQLAKCRVLSVGLHEPSALHAAAKCMRASACSSW